MAKQKQDKEDILREATALVNRVELKLDGKGESDDSVFVGFRRDGAVSFFYGSEPVYQFNNQHAFRRGYYQSTMLKAEQGKLVQLTRSREGEQLVLLRREYNEQQTVEFCEEMRQNLLNLLAAIRSEKYELIGFVVEDNTVEQLLIQVADWIENHAGQIRVANVPNVAG